MANSESSQSETDSIPFSDEQISVLESVFDQCPNPSASQMKKMKRAFPVLRNLENFQLKIWFENQRNLKEDSDVNATRERLTAINRALKEENSNLKNKVNELQSESDRLRQQEKNGS